MSLPIEMIDFVLEQEQEEENEEDWRFAEESEEAVTQLTQFSVSENTARKILFVLRLWKDWVRFISF